MTARDAASRWPENEITGVHRVHGTSPQAARARALIEAATEVAKASSAPPSEQQGGLAFWTGLLEGTWTLVERTVADGRRILVARRNPDSAQRFRVLSGRERVLVVMLAQGHSLKHCAFEVGIAESTASEISRGAMRKMGIRSRAELVEIYGALCGH